MLFRAITHVLAPAGRRSRLSAFYFHRVPEHADPLLPYEPDARMFARILQWITSQFRVLDPLEACERLYAGTLPSRPAIVSFDDGYRDNYTVALPVLRRHRIRAAFFVATAYLEGGMMFNDRVIEAVRRCEKDSIVLVDPDGEEAGSLRLPLNDPAQRRTAVETILRWIKHRDPQMRLRCVEALERETGVGAHFLRSTPLMMDAEQVRALHREGMQVGGHTRTHPILVKIRDEEARAEIGGGISDLASITGERPVLFAYPNGRRGTDFDERHAGMLQEYGVRYAFTTHPGVATLTSPRYELPRFTPWDRSALRFGARSLLNFGSGG